LLALLILACALTAPARAGPVVSDSVSDVSVTIYRDPDRGEGPMDRNWPRGYALISETRTFAVPAGDSVIRFEGVSEGLLPETAIVTGLPNGVREKNRDSRLLSPAGLVDAYLKRAVHIRRTDRKTGKVTEGEAIIQAGPDGGVVLTTADGVEALGCSGLPERMIYDGVPVGLSAKPTLSVLATSEGATTVTVQLTYMAQGFDWAANYVARVSPGGEKLSLFAWLTVANGGRQGFADARLQVIAGKPNKEANAPPLRQPPPGLQLRCWPMDITSTHPRYEFSRLPWQTGAEDEERYDDASDVVVTARRRGRFEMAAMAAPAPPPAPEPVVAKQEELGDLKLYRVPIRVTVAAKSQKQVAMIDQPAADFAQIYRVNVANGSPQSASMPFILRGKNEKDKGLGLPLPAGGLALFEAGSGGRLLAGEDAMADRAIGEDVEIAVGTSPDVRWTLKRVGESKKRQEWRAEITNARDVSVRAEIIVPFELSEKPPGLKRGRGGWAFPVEVPANGTARVDYAIKLGR